MKFFEILSSKLVYVSKICFRDQLLSRHLFLLLGLSSEIYGHEFKVDFWAEVVVYVALTD